MGRAKCVHSSQEKVKCTQTLLWLKAGCGLCGVRKGIWIFKLGGRLCQVSFLPCPLPEGKGRGQHAVIKVRVLVRQEMPKNMSCDWSTRLSLVIWSCLVFSPVIGRCGWVWLSGLVCIAWVKWTSFSEKTSVQQSRCVQKCTQPG